MESRTIVALALAAAAAQAGMAPPTYTNPRLRAPVAIPPGPFMDSAVQKLDDFRRETSRLEDSASKVCLAKASAAGFADPAGYEDCQRLATSQLARRQQATAFFQSRVEQERFRRRILGWTILPVRDLSQGDDYFAEDSTRLRAASQVEFGFSDLARPDVGIDAWDDHALLFRYGLALHVPGEPLTMASDPQRQILSRLFAEGGSIAPHAALPLLSYAGDSRHMALDLRLALPVDVPGLGTVRGDLAAHGRVGLGGSALLVGRRDVIGVVLSGEASYLYGFSKRWRDQLPFASEDGFGLARGGVGLLIYDRLAVLVHVHAGIGGRTGDVVAEHLPVSVTVSVSR